MEKAFPAFRWNKIKRQIIVSLEKIGMICSIAFGIWTMINFIKNEIFNCLKCFVNRQISEGVVNSILLVTNPSTYLLKKMKKDSENSQNDDDATPFKGQQKEKGRHASSELNDLRKLNEQLLLPRYTENM